MAAKAPKIRNYDVMQLWFDAWNADNERARDEYDRIRAAEDVVRRCRKQTHLLIAGNIGSNGGCLACRSEREKNRRGRILAYRKRPRMTTETEALILRRYIEGSSIAALSRQTGHGEELIGRMLERHGVTRTLSEAAVMRWYGSSRRSA